MLQQFIILKTADLAAAEDVLFDPGQEPVFESIMIVDDLRFSRVLKLILPIHPGDPVCQHRRVRAVIDRHSRQ